jgi:hypothetical protein
MRSELYSGISKYKEAIKRELTEKFGIKEVLIALA